MVKIHLGNLPDNCHQESIRDLLQPFGDVTDIHVVRNYAFAHVSPEDSADRAVNALNKSKLFGKEISVEFAKKQHGKNENRRESGGNNYRRKSGGAQLAPLLNSGGILGASPLFTNTMGQSQLNPPLMNEPIKPLIDDDKPDPDVRVRREVVHVRNVPGAEKYGLTSGYVIHERYYVLPSHPLLKGLNTKDIPLMSETNCVRSVR